MVIINRDLGVFSLFQSVFLDVWDSGFLVNCYFVYGNTYIKYSEGVVFREFFPDLILEEVLIRSV